MGEHVVQSEEMGVSGYDDAPRQGAKPDLVCFRPSDVEQRFLDGYFKKGWGKSDLMHRITSAQLTLEAHCADYMERLEAWGVRTRTILPKERRPVGDISWLAEVVSKLAVEHLEQLEAKGAK